MRPHRAIFVILAACSLAACGTPAPVRRAVQAVKANNLEIRKAIAVSQKSAQQAKVAIDRSFEITLNLEDTAQTPEQRAASLQELKLQLGVARTSIDTLTKSLLGAQLAAGAADALADQVRDAATADHNALLGKLWKNRLFGFPISFALGAVAMFFGRAAVVALFRLGLTAARTSVGL